MDVHPGVRVLTPTGASAPYAEPFVLTGPIGNNALSYDERRSTLGRPPSLYVPSAIDGTFDDVLVGERVVFEDVDEHGVLHSCIGLRHFVRATWRGVPTVVMDNHNHAFYFWYDAIERQVLDRGAALVHVDQHRDTRVPARMFDGASRVDAFAYTNYHLNVGNYIVPAERAAMLGRAQFVTGPSGLDDLSLVDVRNKILNIDLDFFAPEMQDVDFNTARRFIRAHLATASMVTIATSPFFIDQTLAIERLRWLVTD